MDTIKIFEDLDAWQLGRELCRSIYSVTDKGMFSKDYGLRDQIQRAAVSVMTNIAEALSEAATRISSSFFSSPAHLPVKFEAFFMWL